MFCEREILQVLITIQQNDKSTKEGYWNLKLDAASSLITTFYMPFERYKFLRMPFG